MPFLDAAPFLAEAVESVLAQSYTAWELLLVDDGSSDGSTAIAREYAAGHPDRIRYLHHPGHESRGASAARNLGIREARGEYLALLDGDDVWLPHKLEEQVPMLDARPAVGMLYGITEVWHGWTGREEDRARDHLLPLGVPLDTTLAPPELLVLRIRGRAASPGTCSVLMRREVVERVGGFEERFRRLYTDQAFYAKMFIETRVHVAGRVWDRYRIHRGSSCSTAEREGRMRAARRAWLDWVAGYLAERGMAHGRLWRQLRIELWLDDHPRIHAALTGSRRGLRRVRQRLGARARRIAGVA
jgi:glycosyltransferase involved in cell wall biosynthesis